MTQPLPPVGSRWRNNKSGVEAVVVSLTPYQMRTPCVRWRNDTPARSPGNAHPAYFYERYTRVEETSDG